MQWPVILETHLLLPAPWRALAGTGPVHAFNPALIAAEDGFALAYRLVLADGRRRIAICRLDRALRPVPESARPLSDLLAAAGRASVWFADPRLLRVGGRLQVYWNSGAELPHNHQYLAELDEATLAPAGPPRELLLAGPRMACEKNWGLFEADGLHAVYSAFPHRVLRLELGGVAEIRCTDLAAGPAERDPDQPFDESFRGAAPLVRIGDELYGIGHSLRRGAGGAVYRAELVTFAARPPFEPRRRLAGGLPLPNPFDDSVRLPRLNVDLRSATYPCGAVFRDGAWLISYGINDEHCAIARLDHREIEAALEPIAAPAARPPAVPPAVPPAPIAGFRSWLDDPHWIAAGKWVQRLARDYRHVLAPAELARLSPRALPLEFACHLDPLQGAVVMPKDDVDRLPRAWLDGLRGFVPLFADAVFVGIAAARPASLRPMPAAERDHLPYLWGRLSRILAGEPVRESRIDRMLSTGPGERPYGLIVCASLTGNAGDRLVGAAAVALLAEACPGLDWIVAGPEIDRSLVAGAAGIVLGPGGFLYDLLDGEEPALDNLAAYGRIGFLAEEYGRPLIGLGLGHQGLVSRPGRAFLRRALESATLIITRDAETTALLREIGHGGPLATLPDLSVLTADEVPAAATVARPGLALCGAFDAEPALVAALGSGLAAAGAPVALRVVLQADEDAAWFGRSAADLAERFGAVEAIDARGLAPAGFIAAIAGADGLVTTRFHAMMIALVAGLPGIVLGLPGDKRARALAALPEPPAMRLVPRGTGAAGLAAALAGLLGPLEQRQRRPVRFPAGLRGQALDLIRRHFAPAGRAKGIGPSRARP